MTDGVWFLFTARDPGPVLETCAEYGRGQQVEVVYDEDPPRGIGPMMDDVYAEYPDLDFYGWLADDTYPQSPAWDLALSGMAGDWHLTYADDGGYLSPSGGPAKGVELTSGLCWGGELVRAAGSWSLGFHSAWLDMAWIRLLKPLGLLRYVPQVTVRHDQWRTGRREMDGLDRLTYDRIDDDQLLFHQWQEEHLVRLTQTIEGRLLCVS